MAGGSEIEGGKGGGEGDTTNCHTTEQISRYQRHCSKAVRVFACAEKDAEIDSVEVSVTRLSVVSFLFTRPTGWTRLITATALLLSSLFFLTDQSCDDGELTPHLFKENGPRVSLDQITTQLRQIRFLKRERIKQIDLCDHETDIV